MNSRTLYTLYEENYDLGDRRIDALAKIVRSIYEKIIELGVDLPDGFDFYDRLTREFVSKDFSEYYQNSIVEVGHTVFRWYAFDSERAIGKQLVILFTNSCKDVYDLMFNSHVIGFEVFDRLGEMSNIMMFCNLESNLSSGIRLFHKEDGFVLIENMMKDYFNEP